MGVGCATGRLLVIDPCFFPLARKVINAALRVAPHDGDFRFYSHREAASLLADLGFEVRQIRRLGLWAFLVDAHKPKLNLIPAYHFLSQKQI